MRKPRRQVTYTVKRSIEERKCLRCQKLFKSEGPFNRLCLICNRMNENLHGSDKKIAQCCRGRKRINGFEID